MSSTANLNTNPTLPPTAGAAVPRTGRGRLLRTGAIIAAAIALANILQGMLQIALAHVLTPDNYSSLVSLFVIITICSVPTLGVQAAVARDVARYTAAGDVARSGAALLGALRSLAKPTLGIAVLGAAVGIPAALALHVQRPGALAAAAVTVVAGIAMPVAWGGLQGAGRFGLLAGAQVAWAALRVLLAIPLAALGFGIGGAMAGVALATILALAGALAVQRPVLSAARSVRRLAAAPLSGRYALGAAAALCIYTALTSLDVPAARLASAPAAAGAYSAASVGARVLLVAAVAATTVLFPRVATLVDQRRERRHLRAGLLVVAAVGAAATAVAYLAPVFTLRAGFGREYTSASGYFALLTLAMALYGIVYVYLYHFLSLGRLAFTVVLGGALAAQVGLYAAFHESGRQLAVVQLGCAAGLALSAEAFERLGRK